MFAATVTPVFTPQHNRNPAWLIPCVVFLCAHLSHTPPHTPLNNNRNPRPVCCFNSMTASSHYSSRQYYCWPSSSQIYPYCCTEIRQPRCIGWFPGMCPKRSDLNLSVSTWPTNSCSPFSFGIVRAPKPDTLQLHRSLL